MATILQHEEIALLLFSRRSENGVLEGKATTDRGADGVSGDVSVPTNGRAQFPPVCVEKLLKKKKIRCS